MNFFEHQARAKRRTSLLVLYFSLAVLLTAMAVNLVCLLAMNWMVRPTPASEWFTSAPAAWIAGATLLIITGGSALRFWQLRDGGAALADMLGARRIEPGSNTSAERQLINIVEEMAIASGIPVPELFVLDNEQAINALVAGHRPTETCVIVTRGALEQLSRDEMQGVIAHEFSHVFNADMRLNLRLIATLAGIVAIGKTGEFLLHNARFSHFDSRGRRQDALPVLLLAGVALMAIGYIGLFFGRLIKAAISRQRELLADAGAVQFTRNPAGIAQALIRIRNGNGSYLNNRHAEDMSHMCFGETLPLKLRGLLATHPPLDERLAAIGSQWPARARADERSRRTATPTPAGADAATPEAASGPAAAMAFAATTGAPAATPPLRPRASDVVGTVTPAHLGYARTIHASIPAPLREALHQPEGAELMICALVLSVSEQPGQLLPSLSLPSDQQARLAHYLQEVQKLGTRLRLPLLDMAIPTLKPLPQAERDQLLTRLEALVRADRRITLFEFVLLHILEDHLGKTAARSQRTLYRSFQPLADEIRLLLSTMIHAGGAQQDPARLFQRLGTALLPTGTTLLPREQCRLDRLADALKRLAGLTPLLKSLLVDACADAVLADRRVQVAEAELLRAVCTLLDCPMPPLFEMTAPAHAPPDRF